MTQLWFRGGCDCIGIEVLYTFPRYGLYGLGFSLAVYRRSYLRAFDLLSLDSLYFGRNLQLGSLSFLWWKYYLHR